MKNKYDIRINPTPLSSDEIAQRKNFDQLLETYQAQAVQTRGKSGKVRRISTWAGAAAAALILGWLAYTGIFTERTAQNLEAQAYFAERPYIDVPPVPAAKPAFVTRSVNAKTGGEVLFTNDSKMLVPSDAFESLDGQPISGEIEIRFREMHDYVDFFLSGIPMVYDSAGVRYTFESAGMLEIYAEQDGKQVKLRPGKSIDVELVSELQMPQLEIPAGYNIYKLDTTARRWDYQNIDRLQILESQVAFEDESHPLYQVQSDHVLALQEIRNREETALKELDNSLALPPAPLEPRFANANEFVFDFDIAAVGNGAINLPYEGALWQLAPGQNIDAGKLNRNWDGMQLHPVNNRDYKLDLIAANETLSVLVVPVLSGNAYEEAMNRYRLDLDYYQQLVANRDGVLASRQKEIKQNYNLERASLQADFQGTLLAYQEEHELEGTMMHHKIINRFTANSFGIWNCDRPVAPKVATIKGKFLDENGQQFTNNLAYLVDKSRNTIERIYIGETTEFHINTNSKNIMWIVTQDDQIAIFRPEDFEALNLEQQNQTFVFERSNRRIDTETDLREILYF
ncbi:MAG: hypothetical protein KDC34_10285 [Saprospiraceae bacterium]|nr:hypothetical protein [Saprospiraceae bacterium]